MPVQLNHRLVAVAWVVTTLVALVLGVMGAVVLGGWAWRIGSFETLIPGLPPMRPDTALWLSLASLSLLLLHVGRGRRPWMLAAQGVAAVLLGAEVLTLSQILTGRGVSLGAVLGDPQVLPVILAYLPVPLALLLLDHEASSGFRPSEFLISLACVLPYLTLLGETYDLRYVSEVLPATGMTLRSALSLISLCVGVFCSRADRGMMALLLSDTPAGILFRRLLPMLLVLPLALGWLRREGERAGLFEATVGHALVMIGFTLVSLIMLSWNVRTFNRLSNERLAAERALRWSAQIVEFSQDAIIGADAQGRVSSWNPAAEKLFGYAPAEILGKSLMVLVPASRQPEMLDTLARERRGEHTGPYETVRVRKDARLVDVAATVSAVRDASGQVVGFGGVLRDITERKRALEAIARREAELHRAQELSKLKDQFLSTVSHEMKTPLTLITGYAELLEDKYPGEMLVAGIQEGSARLSDHVGKMIDFSALVSGAMPLYLSEINFSELLADLRAIVEGGFALKGIALRMQIDPGTPTVRADPRRVTQMLLELLGNAQRYTQKGGEVGIHVAPSGDEVRLEVWDTGQGIAADDLPWVWNMFGRGESGEGPRRGGLGLGLTIVKLLVELHGGHVAIKSKLGEGSCVSLFLPVQARAHDPGAGAA